ncbi:MAG TPA: asparaginase [Pyrinomonadaceae bacterium]|nr:asparaginase [Pyrinomonadaceae bacterium]
MEAEILAKVIRGETVESIHRGHLIVVEGDGNPVAQFGNPETVTFFRSAAKPFQVLPFLLSGGAEAFDFSEREIALACGSHSSEAFHVELAAKMLEKCGLSETDLQCGSHLPFNEKAAEKMVERKEKPTQLYNNCSGKHAAMLAFAKHIGADLSSYLSPENPIQQEILKIVSLFTGVSPNKIKLAVDGCSAPNFALPITAMAKSFARLIFPPASFDEKLKKACRRVVSTMMSFPELIGGTDRLDTMIMEAASGKLISKIGAEGIYLAGVLPNEKWKSGLGIAFKIEDGDDKRARPAVAVELLRQLGVLNARSLRKLSPFPVKSRRGEKVGKVIGNFRI